MFFASIFLAVVGPVITEKEVRVLYTLAENYRINNLFEQALKEYEKVIGKYPQTSWAEKASQRIKEIKAE